MSGMRLRYFDAAVCSLLIYHTKKKQRPPDDEGKCFEVPGNGLTKGDDDDYVYLELKMELRHRTNRFTIQTKCGISVFSEAFLKESSGAPLTFFVL